MSSKVAALFRDTDKETHKYVPALLICIGTLFFTRYLRSDGNTMLKNYASCAPRLLKLPGIS